MRAATKGREIAALSFGSQLDGMVAADADGEPLRPAVIWCDRRAGAECEAVSERVDPERLRELTGCNVDPGHVAPKIAWLAAHEASTYRDAVAFAPPGSWVAWRVTGVLAVDASNASSMGLLDPRARVWSEEACAAWDIDPARLPEVLRADAVLGPARGWLLEATGLDEKTVVVLGAGDEMAATLGAGVVEPGVVCDVLGTAEPVCAVVGEPAHDPTGLVELHPHADPDTWLLENPGWLSGGAYRWFRDELGTPEMARAAEDGSDVYELLDDLAEGAPPGSGGVSWMPSLAGAMAPEWNANARAGWFGVTAAHTRAHLARALLEGNALALRDVIEAWSAPPARRTAAASSASTRAAPASGRTSPSCRSSASGTPCGPRRSLRARPRRTRPTTTRWCRRSSASSPPALPATPSTSSWRT